MKTKPKKRYQTCNEIRDEIERYQQKALRFVQQAEALELSAKELAKSALHGEAAAYNRTQAAKARRSAQRIHDKRLPLLKQKLAEWNTELLPGVITDGDRSIPR